MRPRSYSPQNLRAAAWALRSLRRVRRLLPELGLETGVELAPPPRLDPAAIRGVKAALARSGASCLERGLVLQAWLAAHGEPRELIVGVTAPGEEFRAHAWLAGEGPCHGAHGDFAEIVRRPAAR